MIFLHGLPLALGARLTSFVLPALAACAATFVCATKSRADDAPTRVYDLGDTVRVTDERLRTDPLQSPMATTMVSRESFRDTRQAGLDEVVRDVPGVLAQSRSGSGDVRITIRGFGARGAGERSNAGTTRGIRVNLNGFPLTEPDGRTSLDFADPSLIERVRVVRSNTSALFGPASGGLIDLYQTSAYSAPFYSTRFDFGSFGYAKQAGELAFVSGSSRIRLGVTTSKFDGWREHSDANQTLLNTSIESDPSPRTSIGLFLHATRNLSKLPGALTKEEFEDDPRAAHPDYLTRNERRDNRIGRAAARVSHRFGEGNLLQLAAYVEPKAIHRSERNTYRDFQRVHTGGSALVSWPFAWNERRARWTVGIDDAFQDGSQNFYNLGPGGSRGTEIRADAREGINSFGAFTEVSYEPTPRLELSAGVRGDWVHYIAEDFLNPEVSDSRTLDRASPRAAISFRHRPDHSLYAAVATGIETPAFNEVNPPAPFDTLSTLNPLLDPMFSTTFEVGTKGRVPFGNLDGDRFRYDVALYTLEVENDLIPYDNGAIFMTAGKSRRSGVEFSFDAALDYGLSARLSGSLSKNRYVEYEGLSENGVGQVVERDFSDHDAAGIPGRIVSGGLRYEASNQLFGEVSAHHVGPYFVNDANTERAHGFTTLDLTVGGDHEIAGQDVGLFASLRNATDEKYAASVYINGVNGRFYQAGMERNVVVGLRFRGGL